MLLIPLSVIIFSFSLTSSLTQRMRPDTGTMGRAILWESAQEVTVVLLSCQCTNHVPVVVCGNILWEQEFVGVCMHSCVLIKHHRTRIYRGILKCGISSGFFCLFDINKNSLFAFVSHI